MGVIAELHQELGLREGLTGMSNRSTDGTPQVVCRRCEAELVSEIQLTEAPRVWKDTGQHTEAHVEGSAARNAGPRCSD